jgi:hypothetical protein
MRTLLLAGVLAVAGFAIATPISIAPASAQVAVDTHGPYWFYGQGRLRPQGVWFVVDR